MNKVLFSKKSDDWATPIEIYKYFMERGYIDPCPLNADFDGLKKTYPAKSYFFINPPYSNIEPFVDFAINQITNNQAEQVVLLVPSRTDTKWFQKLLGFSGTKFYFIKGRLKFGNSKNSAPFPSVLISLVPKEITLPFTLCQGMDIKKLILKKDEVK